MLFQKERSNQTKIDNGIMQNHSIGNVVSIFYLDNPICIKARICFFFAVTHRYTSKQTYDTDIDTQQIRSTKKNQKQREYPQFSSENNSSKEKSSIAESREAITERNYNKK